ncbi:MAG: DsbE family thiol:disulfide interchange protein [Legionellaceae bacterium]|nr:DsbE family thiol:disulfide interchange protein [Legionellaceae bacterium]
MTRVYWRLIPLILFGVLAFFLWRGLSLNPRALPSTQIGKQLPAFRLPVLTVGYYRNASESNELDSVISGVSFLHGLDSFGSGDVVLSPKMMRGQIVLLNVWASWCAACTEEQGFLAQLAHEGVVIFGLNYKDQPKDAIQWLKEWGNPYRLIGDDREGRVGIDLGVYGAPETFLIDKQGVVQYRYPGVMNALVWQQEFLPRIRQLESRT